MSHLPAPCAWHAHLSCPACCTAGRAGAEPSSAGPAPPLPPHQDTGVEPVLVSGVGRGKLYWGYPSCLPPANAAAVPPASYKPARLLRLLAGWPIGVSHLLLQTASCCTRRCILDAMFDERFRLKPAFLHNERALQRRLRCVPRQCAAGRVAWTDGARSTCLRRSAHAAAHAKVLQ